MLNVSQNKKSSLKLQLQMQQSRHGLSPLLATTQLHCESEKLDPFSFEHNFGKYYPILIILSLLHTEINYDQVYHKIYHHTSKLLWHYLVKWTRMYWPTLLAWFHNERCNSQTSHTECNKINIVSSQAVLKVSLKKSHRLDHASFFISILSSSLNQDLINRHCTQVNT